MMPLHRWWVLSLLSAAVLAGCVDGPAGNGGTPPSSATVNVGNIFYQSVHNGSMDPAADTVAAGGSVTWEWIEVGTHSVRFDDPALSEGPAYTETGSVFSMLFPTAGTYTYDCGLHGTVMTGTIVVK